MIIIIIMTLIMIIIIFILMIIMLMITLIMIILIVIISIIIINTFIITIFMIMTVILKIIIIEAIKNIFKKNDKIVIINWIEKCIIKIKYGRKYKIMLKSWYHNMIKWNNLTKKNQKNNTVLHFDLIHLLYFSLKLEIIKQQK